MTDSCSSNATPQPHSSSNPHTKCGSKQKSRWRELEAKLNLTLFVLYARLCAGVSCPGSSETRICWWNLKVNKISMVERDPLGLKKQASEWDFVCELSKTKSTYFRHFDVYMKSVIIGSIIMIAITCHGRNKASCYFHIECKYKRSSGLSCHVIQLWKNCSLENISLSITVWTRTAWCILRFFH